MRSISIPVAVVVRQSLSRLKAKPMSPCGKRNQALLQTEQRLDALEESWCTSEQADEKTPDSGILLENESIDVGRDDDTSIQQTNKIKRRFEDDELVPLSTWTRRSTATLGQQHTIASITFPAIRSYKTVVATTRATVLVVAAVMTNMCT
jgi:hypothetical protein